MQAEVMPENNKGFDLADCRGREFRTTHWSVVLEAAGSSEESRSALENLCGQYWQPLYVFVRGRGYRPEQAQDLTQEFFAGFLAADSLEKVHPDKGKFRTFLLAALKNFLLNDWRDSNRLKRGGGKEFISWDAFDAEDRAFIEPVGEDKAEMLYDKK